MTDTDKARNVPERMMDFGELKGKTLSKITGTVAEIAGLDYPREGRDVLETSLESARGEGWYGYGARTGPEALERCRSGWPEGRAMAQETLGELTLPRMGSTRRRRRRGRVGDEVDMQRVYRGDLDRAWEHRARDAGVRAGQSRVTLAVNFAANAGTKPEDMFWPGAAAIRLADALESAGREVRIMAVAPASISHVYVMVRMIAKDYGEVLDLDRIAGATAFPGAFRSAGFIAIATACARIGKRVPMGLGAPLDLDDFPDFEIDGQAPAVIRVPQLRSLGAAERFLASVQSDMGG